MKYIKYLLFDKIVLQLFFYLIFVMLSIATIFMIDNYMHKRIIYINDLYNNEAVKIQLNDLLKSKISKIENLLLSYTNAESFKDMDVYERRALVVLDELTNILYVLEYGGVYEETLNLNYEGKESAVHRVEYSNNSSSRYNIQVLDIRAKFIDIKELIDTYRSLVIDLVIARKSGSIEKFNETIAKQVIASKEMEAFFTRLDENSNRMYVEAEESEKHIKSYLNSTIEQFKTLKLRVNFFIGLVIVGVGFFMFTNIFRTIQERMSISRELNDLNESLETTIAERTRALESEVLVRKQKEIESRQKAQFLIDVIESLGHPFYVIDVETYKIEIANGAAYSALGGHGKTCYELTHHSNHPCDSVDHPCPLKTVLETGKPVAMEHIHIVKGEKRYVEVHGYPVKDESGKVVQMIEYSLDVTEKKEAEVALISLNSMLEEKVAERTKKLESEIKHRQAAEDKVRIREKHFRHIIDNISDVIAILDTSYRIKYISPSIEYICDYSPSQMIGKSFDEILHSKDRKIFARWIDKVKSEMDISGLNVNLQKRTGQFISGEASAKNLLDDEVIEGIIINVRDVTEKRAAEKEMRKLALVMDQNPISIVVTDTEGKIEYVNPAFEKVTGYKSSEVIGCNPSILKTENTPEEVHADLWKTITKGKVWHGELYNKSKDGKEYIEEAIIAPILNGKSEIINYLGMKENVTEIVEARQKTEEINKAKEQFFTIMSHELRTPLNGLIGFVDLLNGTDLSEEQTDYIDTIKFSADNLLKILNDILDLSKIGSGSIQLENTEMDIRSNVLNTAKTFYAKAAEKSVRLNTYLDPMIPHLLMGDSLRINQILTNLLNNAVKFTDEGGRISVTLEKTGETDSGMTLMLTVEDNGVGIPEDKLESIFDSFTQADASISRKFGGSGLGLAISKDLLKLMGSEISVTSEVGVGSRFFFELTLDKVKSHKDVTIVPVEKPVYVYGECTAGLCRVLDRYLKDFGAEYSFTDDNDKITEGTVIFNNRSYDETLAESFVSKGLRVVFITDNVEKTYSFDPEKNIIIISRPFDGRVLYEAISGVDFSEAVKEKSSAEDAVFSGRILVAEDNIVNIKLMETMFKRMGISIDLAKDGVEAVEAYRNNPYDLIFMDLTMPNMDGDTAVMKIREMEAGGTHRATIIAITAYTKDETDKLESNKEFDGFLSKPVRYEEIEDTVNKYTVFQ